MRKLWLLALLAAAACLSAMAADAPQPSGLSTDSVEIFGGFSYLHLDTVSASTLDAQFNQPAGTLSVKRNYPGWNAAVQFNLTRWLGIVADGSGYYGTPISPTSGSAAGFPTASFYSALFGPSVTLHRGTVRPFLHALFGLNRVAVDASTILGTSAFTDDAFAMALGGGLDVRVSKRFSVRLGQADYLYTQHDTTSFGGVGHQNNLRFSTGVVFTFGSHD